MRACERMPTGPPRASATWRGAQRPGHCRLPMHNPETVRQFRSFQILARTKSVGQSRARAVLVPARGCFIRLLGPGAGTWALTASPAQVVKSALELILLCPVRGSRCAWVDAGWLGWAERGAGAEVRADETQ